jgi:hypothetical protein
MIILGVEGDERTTGFSAALVRAGLPPARVLDYRAFMADPHRLTSLFASKENGARRRFLRLDSPGGDFSMWRAFASFGATIMAAAGETPLDNDALDRLEPEVGLLTATRQHHLGFIRALHLARSLTPEGARLLNDVNAIELFYDKTVCHGFMQRNGFPVPRGLGPVKSFAELASNMGEARTARAFVKQRHGSGGSGVAALSLSPQGTRAWSSAELVQDANGARLYNTKTMRQYDGAEAVALINAICALDGPAGAHAEHWTPKATADDHVCDLRLLVIGGEPAHAVLRMSQTPITNLDLRNRRESADMLRSKVAPAVWEALIGDCRRFAALFPRALQISLDAAVTVNLRRHVFFEANAFGDMLRRVTHNGLDPYDAQIAALGPWGKAA